MSGAVGKSFQVLEGLVGAHGAVRLSALADELGLQRSTAHRVLAELVELGYVHQDEAGLYRPTLRMWEMGNEVAADLPIKQVASNALVELHDRTGETVSLITRSGDDALYLDKLISPRPMRFTTRVGSRVPLPLPAGGKAILAFTDDGPEIVERVAARETAHRSVDVDAVLRALEQIRRTGLATSSARPGARSFAAPILDRDRSPVGALSVSAPTDRLERDRRDAIIDHVVSTATRLSESLGHL